MLLLFQVRLFDISLDTPSFLRGFEAQEGRVLSLAWHPSGEHMAVGGADSIIRKYDVKNGRCLLRITLDDFKSRSTLVWDVKFLSDSTIVSADSLGKVQLWNGKHGTLIQSFHLHLADVLTLAVSAGEDEIYSSGVDAKILCIRKAKSKGSKWVKSGEVRAHTHDVRALALSSSSGLLASGGVDTQLIVCPTDSFDVDSCIKYHPFPDSSRFFSVAPKANVLMLQSSSSLKFWQLSAQHRVLSGNDSTPTMSTSAASTSTSHLHLNGGRIDSEAESSTSEASRIRTKSPRSPVATMSSSTSQEKHPFLHCTNGMPVNFLEIKCTDPGFILSSALSPDASHVALSTVDRLWLYSIEHWTLTASCVKQTNLPCYKMSFTADRQTLILATVDQGVKIVDISDHGSVDFEASRSLSIGKRSSDDIFPPRHPVVDFELNPDCSMIATISSHRRIYLCNLQTGELLRKLPRLGNQPISFSFHPSKRVLVLFAGGSEREMYSYDISGDHLHLIGNLQMDRKYNGRSKLSHPNRMFALQQQKSDLFAVYDNDCIILIRCKIPEVSKKSQATSSRKRKLTSYKGEPLSYQLILSYQLVLFASRLTSNELVVVERPWSEVLNRLPPTLVRNRYGT